MAVVLELGDLRQSGALSAPVSTPDAFGGETLSYQPLTLTPWFFKIRRASSLAAERVFASTVIAHATHMLSGRYNPEITTKTRIVWVDYAGATHTADVLDVDDTDGAGVETVALVSEIAP